MAKVFEFDPTYWMVDKVSGTALTNSWVVFKNTNKWLAGYFGWSSYAFIDSTFMFWQKFSLICIASDSDIPLNENSNIEITTWTYPNDNIILIAWANTSYSYRILVRNYLTNNVESLWALSSSRRLNPYFYAITYDLQKIRFYLDWILIKESNFSYTNPAWWFNKISLWVSSLNTRFKKWYIYWVTLHNIAFTQKEITNEYKKFLQLQPLLEKKTNFFYPKPTTLSEPWLVAAYNMKPNGSTLVDISWTWNNGTIVWAYPNKNWMSFDWTTNYITVPHNTGLQVSWAFSFSTVINIKLISAGANAIFAKWISWATFNYFVDFSLTLWYRFFMSWLTPASINSWAWTTVLWLTTLSWSYNWIDTLRLYINWVPLTPVTVSWSPTVDIRDLIIWARNRSGGGIEAFFGWYIDDLRIYKWRVLSDQEMKNYHNKWARQIVFKETFAYDKASWESTTPTGWIKWTWVFKLVTNTTAGLLIKKWSKYLECTTLGTIKYPIALVWTNSCTFLYYDWASWSRKTGTLTAIVALWIGFAITGGFLTITTTVWKRFADIVIKQWIEV